MHQAIDVRVSPLGLRAAKIYGAWFIWAPVPGTEPVPATDQRVPESWGQLPDREMTEHDFKSACAAHRARVREILAGLDPYDRVVLCTEALEP